jgi:hypothetical protein
MLLATLRGKYVLAFLTSILIIGCHEPSRYECPCAGTGWVVNGTIITIDEKNPGDEEKIIKAIEKRLGGKCCDLSALPPQDGRAY